MSLPPYIADFFFNAFKAAEFQSRSTLGFFWWHAAIHIISDLLFKMDAQFFVELAFGARFVNEPAQPVHHSAPYSVVRRITATASDSRSQFRTSVSNCFLPFLVSE